MFTRKQGATEHPHLVAPISGVAWPPHQDHDALPHVWAECEACRKLTALYLPHDSSYNAASENQNPELMENFQLMQAHFYCPAKCERASSRRSRLMFTAPN